MWGLSSGKSYKALNSALRAKLLTRFLKFVCIISNLPQCVLAFVNLRTVKSEGEWICMVAHFYWLFLCVLFEDISLNSAFVFRAGEVLIPGEILSYSQTGASSPQPFWKAADAASRAASRHRHPAHPRSKSRHNQAGLGVTVKQPGNLVVASLFLLLCNWFGYCPLQIASL